MMLLISLLGGLMLFSCALFILLLQSIRAHTRNQQHVHEFNMAMAEATASATNPLKYEDIVKIAEGVIVNLCVMDTIMNGYGNFTKENLSLILDDIIEDIAVRSEQGLSKEFIRQWEKFVTPEYRTEWILFKVRTSILYQINNAALQLKNNASAMNQRPIGTVSKRTVNWSNHKPDGKK